MIKHDNIFYIRDLSEIGGVETFIWEMVKKYKDNDIAVVYKQANIKQLIRVKKYCRAYKLEKGDLIDCKVAIINYDTSVIDQITPKIYRENAKEDEGIYQVVHGDYENPAYSWKPPTDDRIKQYIGVTKYIRDSFKRITGLENVIYSYNPLSIEREEKKLVLLSATRLSPIKGKDRMIKLVNEMDKKGINYIWYVFTNDTNAIQSPNVIYMKPRLDIGYWMEQADYVIQLSDTEACSYTINEALYRNVPVIVTPLPYLSEIGVKNNKNAYIIDFDCSNIEEVVNKINNIPKFEFKHLEDGYNQIIYKGKSHYEEEKRMKAKIQALIDFADLEENSKRKIGDEWICSKERAEYLKEHNAVEILEIIEEKKLDEEKIVEKVLKEKEEPFVDKIEAPQIVIEEEKPKKKKNKRAK